MKITNPDEMVDQPAGDADIRWKPFSLTYVSYIEGTVLVIFVNKKRMKLFAGDLVGKVLAISSLAPLAILVAYGTLVVFRRDLCTVRMPFFKFFTLVQRMKNFTNFFSSVFHPCFIFRLDKAGIFRSFICCKN